MPFKTSTVLNTILCRNLDNICILVIDPRQVFLQSKGIKMNQLITLIISVLISQTLLANIINLDSEIRTTPATNSCNFGEKLMATEFKFYEDPEAKFADWIGYVVFKPKFKHPERIPQAGLDLAKAERVIFPADTPEDCDFRGTIGVIRGTEDDEIGLLFVGKGCESVVNIFKENKFSELGLEWTSIKTADERNSVEGLTMTILNPKQICR